MSNAFIEKYKKVGEQKFYSFLLTYALNKILLLNTGESKTISPELEYLEYYNRFIILYRRDGDAVNLEIAKCFRKAAHKIYRIMLKKNMIEKNYSFLNLV
jgi:hypothetical protein